MYPIFRSRSSSCYHWQNILSLVLVFLLCLHERVHASDSSKLTPERIEPDRFESKIIATNLIQPMEMAVAPDDSVFLIEIGGSVKRIDPSKGSVEVVAQLNVTTAQENGLIGIALDPEFLKNGFVYLQYSPPDYSGQRISRFTFRDGRLDVSSESILLSYEEQRLECCHHAGSMEFDRSGNLYIGTGDNTNPFGSEGHAPIDEREGRSPWDAQRTSGNTQSYNGKILRIHPTSDGKYLIPDGNLFPKDGSKGLPEIYVMGCRNPWRLNIDQQTGYLYWGDVGPDAGNDGPRGPMGYDEVNQARQAGNFGWPYFIANNRPYPLVDFADNSIHEPLDPSSPKNDSINNTGVEKLSPAIPAWIYYPGKTIDQFPAVGTGGRTACAGPIYHFENGLSSNTQFPEYFNKTAFIYEWSRNWIVAVHLDDQSNIRSMERFLPDQKFSRPIDLAFDSKGSLYVLNYGETWGVNPDANLIRLDYIRGNRSPIAKASVKNSIGKEPLTVLLSSQGSLDKDQDECRFQWTVFKTIVTNTESRSEMVARSDKPEYELNIDQPGLYQAELTMTDPSGAISVASVPITVGNALPEIQFLEPKDGDFFSYGKSIPYRLAVTDIEDGASDPDVAEEFQLSPIDALAPSRMGVRAAIVGEGNADSDKQSLDPPGLAQMRSSDCLNCHALDRPLVGPMFVDIANKYRDQPGAMETSIDRVLKGSSGVWGKVPMLPHSQLSREQIREMVAWVFTAKPDASTEILQGASNLIQLASQKKDGIGRIRIEGTYADLGFGEIPSQTGSTAIYLRSRTVQIELADAIQGPQTLGSHRAENGRFLGAIADGHYVVVKQLPLRQFRRISARVTSNGNGGMIEVRNGSLDGPLLAQMQVIPNGDWDSWYDSTSELIERTDTSLDRADLYIRFVHPEKLSGLMNVDSITFHLE